MARAPAVRSRRQRIRGRRVEDEVFGVGTRSPCPRGTWFGLLPTITAESPWLTVAAFAIDTEGNVSLPVTRSVAGDMLFGDDFEQ